MPSGSTWIAAAAAAVPAAAEAAEAAAAEAAAAEAAAAEAFRRQRSLQGGGITSGPLSPERSFQSTSHWQSVADEAV